MRTGLQERDSLGVPVGGYMRLPQTGQIGAGRRQAGTAADAERHTRIPAHGVKRVMNRLVLGRLTSLEGRRRSGGPFKIYLIAPLTYKA